MTSAHSVRQYGDGDFAGVAALLGDRTRATMLDALMGGLARPAGELARIAGVSAATASGHLKLLVDAELVTVRARGRHRYYELAGPRVAEAIETLTTLARPTPVTSLRGSRERERLRGGRSCYDHLAGELGIGLHDAVLALGEPREVLADALRHLGEPLPRSRRLPVRDCLDWTERRHHLAGSYPAALLSALLDRDWLVRGTGRAVRLTGTGARELPVLLPGFTAQGT